MSKLKINNNGRRYVLVDLEWIWVRPTLFGKRVKKDRLGYDTPNACEFPITAIRTIEWSEGWLLASPSLTITCVEGSNDPWRSSKGQKPWKFKFGSDVEDLRRNRALYLAWSLHLALRQKGFHLLAGTLPGHVALMPTRGEQARAKAGEMMAGLGEWFAKQINKIIDAFEKAR